MVKGFKMKLYPGMAAEYEKRHNELWPEMVEMIHAHGGRNYSIFWIRKPIFYLAILRSRTKPNGRREQIRPSTASGGILWSR